MTEPAPRSDLGTRTLSAIVMVTVAAVALWFGGMVFTAFVAAAGLGVLWEWWSLARRIAKTPLGAAVWLAAGVSYIGVAMAVLVGLRDWDIKFALLPVVVVIAVDVGAYFAGRTIGGPKIAPRISPSKTWAGLGGGVIVAAVALVLFDKLVMSLFDLDSSQGAALAATVVGVSLVLAIIAQAGDFFESWMKRRAGVKDSGRLIPGHGGLFDRADGLLAVLFAGGIVLLAAGQL